MPNRFASNGCRPAAVHDGRSSTAVLGQHLTLVLLVCWSGAIVLVDNSDADATGMHP